MKIIIFYPEKKRETERMTEGERERVTTKLTTFLVRVQNLNQNYSYYENLREAMFLSRLQHVNIIELKGILRKQQNLLYLVYVTLSSHALLHVRTRALPRALFISFFCALPSSFSSFPLPTSF